MLQSTPSPAPRKPSRLRLIQDEEAVPYDGHPPTVRGHMTVIEDATVESVCAACGMTGGGLYMLLERRVGKDGAWICTLDSLAVAFGCSVRHVRDTAKALEDAGFIRRESVLGPRGATIAVRFVLPHHYVRTYGAEPTPEPRAEPTPEPSRAQVDKVSNVEVDTSNGGYPPTPRKRTGPAYSEEFEEFWRAYPKGGGNKVKAFDQWRRLRPDDDLRGEIMAGLVDWKLCDRWRRGFVKAADIWLRDRWWEDEPPREAQANLNGHTVRNGKDIGWSNEQIDAYLAEAEAQGLIPQQRGPR